MADAHTKPDRRSRCCDKPWYLGGGRYVCAGCEAPWKGRQSEMPDLGDQSYQPTDPIELEQKKGYLKWSGLAHYVYHQFSATDNTYIAAQHPLCPTCHPDLLKGDNRPWLDVKIETTSSNGSQTGTSKAEAATSVPTATEPAKITTATAALPAEAPVGRAADKASWAYEPRQAYLVRKLKHFPGSAQSLISKALWTGRYDDEGLPVPAENPAWFSEVWPVYDGSEPTLNKMRSLRDTLIVSPESGPRLIAAGLWTGEYDAQGLPVPCPARSSR